MAADILAPIADHEADDFDALFALIDGALAAAGDEPVHVPGVTLRQLTHVAPRYGGAWKLMLANGGIRFERREAK